MANRKKQIEALQVKAQALSEDVDALLDELQQAYDNMPESLQDSERGEKMDQRIDTLTDWRNSLQDMAEADDV